MILARSKAASKSSIPWKRIDVSEKMTSLISSGPRDNASSSRASDHSHQIGVLPKMSSKTLESTSVTGLFPARDRHDLVRGKPGTGNANQAGKATRLARAVGLFDYDAPIGGSPEFDSAAGTDPEEISNRLWYRYLTFARDRRCHLGIPQGNTSRKYGNTTQIVQYRRWLIAS